MSALFENQLSSVIVKSLEKTTGKASRWFVADDDFSL